MITGLQPPHRGGERRIVLFEPSCYGHHPNYLRLLVEYWVAHRLSGHLSVVVSPEFVRAHGEVARLIRAAEASKVELITMSAAEARTLARAKVGKTLSLQAFLKTALDPSERFLVEWQLACQYGERLGATHCLLMYFDACHLAAAYGLPAPCDISGIYFRPTFHYADVPAELGELDKIQKLQERFILARVLKHPRLKRLFMLDREAVESLGDPACYLPDPVARQVASTAAADQLRRRFGVQPGRRVFLMFGEFSSRKGLFQLLAALQRLPDSLCQQVCLLLTGPLISLDLDGYEARVRELEASRPVQIIRRHEHVPQAEVGDYFAAADAVLAPYQRHVGSSGILLLAAAYGKPVLSQDYGLMGQMAQKYRMGLVADTTDPAAIAAALSQMIREPARAISPTDREALLDLHSPDHFGETVFSELLSVACQSEG